MAGRAGGARMNRFARLEARAPLTASESAKPMADINVTPLVDVMLVLVVIFILAAPLMVGSVHIELPRADSAAPQAPGPQQASVSIDANGRVSVGDEVVEMAQLAQRLARRAQADALTEVLLRADRRVPHGRVIEVMDVAQRAGLSRIGFVTEAGGVQPP